MVYIVCAEKKEVYQQGLHISGCTNVTTSSCFSVLVICSYHWQNRSLTLTQLSRPWTTSLSGWRLYRHRYSWVNNLSNIWIHKTSSYFVWWSSKIAQIVHSTLRILKSLCVHMYKQSTYLSGYLKHNTIPPPFPPRTHASYSNTWHGTILIFTITS